MVVLGIFVGIISWTTYFLVFSEKLTVLVIQVEEDGEVIEMHPFEDLLQKYKGSNLLLIGTDELENYLRQRYTQYESLMIEKNFPDTLTLVLKNYALVSNITIENDDGEETFWLINRHGNLIAGETQEELPWIKIQTNDTFTEGIEVIPQDRLAFILEANQNFEDKFGMEVEYTLYFHEAREAHLWTERSFYVWLDLTNDLDTQLNKLKKALPSLNIYEESLEYIDLRVSGVNGEKVIFKRKE